MNEIYINKFFYSVVAITGIIIIIFMGFYAGYTIKENEKFLDTTLIKYTNFINTKFVYNIKYTTDNKYGADIGGRISDILVLFSIISICLIEIGYRGIHKYKSDKPLYKVIYEESIKAEKNNDDILEKEDD